MEKTGDLVKRGRGKQLLTADKMALTDLIYEQMERGYHSINGLADRLQVSRTTVRRYKPFAEKRFNSVKLNRTHIRNLELYRANLHRERLINELEVCTNIKDKMAVSNQIAKFSQIIVVISGIGAEAKINQFNENKQLVIIRALQNQ